MSNSELFFNDNEFIVSKTDLSGRITYGNNLFISMSGYSEKELLGSAHNILRHEDMPKIIFKLLWERVQAGKEIFAFVKNRTKQDDYYWVFAHVTPSIDGLGKVVGYHSVRRKPTDESLAVIKPLYTAMLDAERVSGVNASKTLLDNTLLATGNNYDQFVLSF